MEDSQEKVEKGRGCCDSGGSDPESALYERAVTGDFFDLALKMALEGVDEFSRVGGGAVIGFEEILRNGNQRAKEIADDLALAVFVAAAIVDAPKSAQTGGWKFRR